MLLTITRHVVDWPDGPRVRRRQTDNWHVLAVADDQFTSLTDIGSAVSLVDSPMTALGRNDGGLGAFASFDSHTRRGTAHRSFSSGTSLYYFASPQGDLYLSTRISGLRAAGVPIAEDRDRLPEFFVLCYICAPSTYFKNVQVIPLDERLEFNALPDGVQLRLVRTFELPEVRPTLEPDTPRRTAEALTRAMRMVTGGGSKRAAVLLSGGVDSSVLARIASLDDPGTATFGTSYPFEHPQHDQERAYAESAAASMGTTHQHYVPTTREYLEGLIHAIAAAEVPLHGLQTVLLSCLYRRAIPTSARIIVNGDGADTVFGTGDHRALFTAGTPWPGERLVNGWLPALLSRLGVGYRVAEGMRRRQSTLRSKADPNYYLWRIDQFGQCDWVERYFDVRPPSYRFTRERMVSRHSAHPLLSQLLALDLFGAADFLQTMWARLGRMAGWATYYPYTHPDVMSDALMVPWRDRCVPESKAQLKAAARRLGVPELVLTRPKAHFGIAPDRWASQGGVLEPLVALAAPVVGEATIRSVQSPDERVSRIYWNLLNYSIWYRLFILDEAPNRLLAALDTP